MTLSARILLADSLRRVSAPCCSRIHILDPGRITAPIHCCSRVWIPRRGVSGGVELREQVKASA